MAKNVFKPADIMYISRKVFIERGGKVAQSNVRFRDTGHLVNICQRIAVAVGRRVDESSPMVDARLKDGSRVNIVFPPLALDGPYLSIRKFGKKTINFDRLVGFGAMTPPVARVLEIASRIRLNVIISGGTGSGKTTLMNAMSQLIDPSERVVTVEDAAELQLQQPHVVRMETRPPNIENEGEVTTRELRSQIAVVTQEIILFNDTVSRNIELGRPGATQEEIIAAARHANAHEFIMENPKGYDTMIGEKGVMFSGGQRQRLAIARAVLRNAPILILDEATSSLDTEAEREVQNELDELMKGRTTLCIAHRLSTILRADLIVVLHQGRIVETGTHAELVRRGGIYQKLYELQFAS